MSIITQVTQAFHHSGLKLNAPRQPDIQYHPDENKWKARTAWRLAEDPSLSSQSLPNGFPRKLNSPLVWEGKDWKHEKEWVHELSQEHLREIDDALNHFCSLNKPLGYISQDTFPLPSLGPVLSDLSRELHSGRGFFVLRTIPVSSYTRTENVIIYAGVSAYVGNLRAVQGAPDVLSHIRDLTSTHSTSAIGSPAYTTDKQVYHTDSGDIISLFALDTAAEGGTSRISSSWRVYNELAETRPDFIRTLSEPWAYDTFGGQDNYILRPLLFYLDSKIIIQYARRAFTGFLGLPRSTGIPPITEAQAEALDTLHFLAEKYALGLNFQKGDIQYINNLSIFHARDGYVDTPEKTRHLLRLWLRNEDLAWETPEELKSIWKGLYYAISPDEQRFPLEAEIRKGSRGNRKN